jgi:hypothetical protein
MYTNKFIGYLVTYEYNSHDMINTFMELGFRDLLCVPNQN